MDLTSRKWDQEILDSSAMPAALTTTMLGDQPVPAYQVLGPVSKLVVDTWGLRADCRIVASSGDNPCTLAGLGLAQPGDLALSLGTSDTLLGVTAAKDAQPRSGRKR